MSTAADSVIAVSESSEPAQVQGFWRGRLFSTIFDCNLGIERTEELNTSFSISQNGSSVSNTVGPVCNNEPFIETGRVSANSMFSTGQRLASCPSGDAAIIHTSELRQVDGDSAQEMVFRVEFVCPDGENFCFEEWVGEGVRTSSSPDSCEATTTATMVTPSSDMIVMEMVTPNPPTVSPTNSCDSCDLRGCCSGHGGVSFCSGNRSLVSCSDGTRSPSCRC